MLLHNVEGLGDRRRVVVVFFRHRCFHEALDDFGVCTNLVINEDPDGDLAAKDDDEENEKGAEHPRRFFPGSAAAEEPDERHHHAQTQDEVGTDDITVLVTSCADALKIELLIKQQPETDGHDAQPREPEEKVDDEDEEL